MSWLREHRVLLIVYGIALCFAAAELRDPDLRPGKPDEPELFLAPDVNIADVSADLYPQRALSLYYRAYQASLCTAPRSETGAACRKRGRVERGEVRELLENALGTGNRSIELVFYNYAIVLLQENAPRSEVDAAIRAWRMNHPNSTRPDPRVVHRKMREERAVARTP